MKILLTGASSFTGYWFAKELAAAGHEVFATLTRDPGDYDGVRGERVGLLKDICATLPGCSFGDRSFIDAVRDHGPWDAFCHHAADVREYKSPDFDVVRALENNTRNLSNVLEALLDMSCGTVVLTGSVFEQNEGTGSGTLRAFSPYGLSKGLTFEMFRYYAELLGMRLGKFVIPNPFGPYEEPRFTQYLIRTWMDGGVPTIQTPAYVRDNIHVSLMAKAYAQFCLESLEGPLIDKLNPSGYVESQGAFAQRFAREMRSRIRMECPLEFADQKEFPEPRVRVNTDAPDPQELGWSEQAAWDELAEYYLRAFGKK